MDLITYAGKCSMATPNSTPLLSLVAGTGGPLLLLFLLVLLPYPATPSTDFVIYSDPPTALVPGQSFQYDLTPQGLPYGPASLHMQQDCDLVAYFHNEKTWATNTSGLGAGDCYLTVDSHGEAALLHNLNYPLWKSGARSTAKGDYALLLQYNGGLAVYGPGIWSSGNQVEYSSVLDYNITTDYVFYSYTVLPIGRIVEYNELKLVLRDDCNLVLLNTATGAIKWESNSRSPLHDCFVTLDDKGELFVKHNRRDVLWRSGAQSTSNLYMLALRYDSTLAVYGPQVWTNKPFW